MATELRATCRSAAAGIPRLPIKFWNYTLVAKHAASTGNAALCEYLMNAKTVYAYLLSYDKMLHWAAKAGDRKLCDWLIDVKKASVLGYIIYGAAKYGHVELYQHGVDLCSKHGIYFCDSLLTWCVCKGSHPENLLLFQAKPNYIDVLSGYARGGHLDLLRQAVQNKEPSYSAALAVLCHGIRGLHLDVCKFAIETMNADYNFIEVSHALQTYCTPEIEAYFNSLP